MLRECYSIDSKFIFHYPSLDLSIEVRKPTLLDGFSGTVKVHYHNYLIRESCKHEIRFKFLEKAFVLLRTFGIKVIYDKSFIYVFTYMNLMA